MLTLEDGADRLSRNVDNQTPIQQNSKGLCLYCTVVEALNLAKRFLLLIERLMIRF